MSSFMKEIYIEASPETVWAVLADIGSIYRWNPGVESSASLCCNCHHERRLSPTTASRQPIKTPRLLSDNLLTAVRRR